MTFQAYRIAVVISDGIAAPYILMDFADAFESLGHTVIRIDIRSITMLSRDEQGMKVNHIKKQVKEFAPHFAIGYGANALLPLASNDPDAQEMHVFEALKIPYCFLMFDSPFYYSGLSLIKLFMSSVLSTVFIWDQYYLQRFCKQIGPAFYLPLATNIARFRPQNCTSKYQADVSFIGSISEIYNFEANRREMKWSPHLMEITQLTLDLMRKTGVCLDDALAEL